MVDKPVATKVSLSKAEKKIDSIDIAAKENIKTKTLISKPKKEVKEDAKVEVSDAVDNTVHIGFFKTVYKPSIPKEKTLAGEAAIFPP